MGKNKNTEDATDASTGEKSCPHFSVLKMCKIRHLLDDFQKNICDNCEKNKNTKDEINDLWVCLTCGHIACGRSKNAHALKHFETNSEHFVAINYSEDERIWCYKCDNHVDIRKSTFRKKVQDIRTLLHKPKNVNEKRSLPLCQNIENSTKTLTEKEKKCIRDFPKVRGLANMGNTCFFNAVLQCLAQTPYLTKVLDDLKVSETFILADGKATGMDGEDIHFPSMEGTLDNEFKFDFIPILHKTLTEIQSNDSHCYRPYDLMNYLKKSNSSCSDGGQHDSHEVLRQLLEFVRAEDFKRYKQVILKNLNYDPKKKSDGNYKIKVKFYGCQASNRFLGPDLIFRGEMVSMLQCLECGHTSSNTETFLDLSLPVMVDKQITPISKRKSCSFDNSVDSIDNNGSKLICEQELKIRPKSADHRKLINRMKNQKNNLFEEIKDNIESEESDADTDINFSIGHEDIQVTESLETQNETEFSNTNSLDVHKNLVNPEDDTISPVNNLLRSEGSPTNLIPNIFEESESLELESSVKEDSKQSEASVSFTTTIDKEKSPKNKLTNGISNIKLSSPKSNPSRSQEFRQKYSTDRECSVHSCLNQFTAKELMNGNNTVGCTACTEKANKGKQNCKKMVCTDSTKKYLISKVPPVLILHLKRFQVQKYGFNKVGERVSFPIVLDLSPIMQNPSKPRKYSLYGIVEHSGTMFGGHYVAYVKVRAPIEPDDPRWSFLPSKNGFKSENISTESDSNLKMDETSIIESPEIEPPPGQWYFVSDTSVRPVDESYVLKSQAYLLFYERIL